jgi:hypothetical protein
LFAFCVDEIEQLLADERQIVFAEPPALDWDLAANSRRHQREGCANF